MTPHSPSRHPEVETLADLAEDLLPAAEAATVREHLSGCAECADTYAALTEVSLLLGESETEPIPADIAARIDAALAVEAAGPRIQPSPRPSPQGAPVPLQPSAPPGRRAESTGPGRPRRRRVGRLLLVTAVAASGLITAATLVFRTGPDHYSTGASSSAARPALAPTASDNAPEYRQDQLSQEVHQLLARQSARPHAQSLGTEGTGGVPDCVSAAAEHPGDAPLATGPGRYGAGQAVTVLVYRSTDAPNSLDVYLITPDCPGATVLLHRTIPA